MRSKWRRRLLINVILALSISLCPQSAGVEEALDVYEHEEPIYSLPISVFDRETRSSIETVFELYPGQYVENRLEQFRQQYALEDQHMKELRNVVRDGLLVRGHRLIPLSTLVVPVNPGDLNDNPSVSLDRSEGIRKIFVSNQVSRPFSSSSLTQGGRVPSSMPSLLELMHHDQQQETMASRTYGILSPLTRLRKGCRGDAAALFLEYERFRYASTGSFKGPLVLLMSCSKGGQYSMQPQVLGEDFDVILWGSSAMEGLNMSSFETNKHFLKELLSKNRLSSSLFTLPYATTQKWLACEGMGRLPNEGGALLDILIVIIAQGEDDEVTPGVFMDLAHVLQEGFKDLGIKTAIGMCDFLDRCSLPREGPQWLILAPHNLAAYVDAQDLPAVLSRDDLIPPSSILYNFEHVHLHKNVHDSEAQGPGSLAKGYVFEIYRKYNVWDYSWSNVGRLQDHYNISATYVPVGYSPCLQLSDVPAVSDHSEEGEGEISVLFFGSVLPRRMEVIQELRAAGIPVLYPSVSKNGTFGKELDDYIKNAKIVLSLLAFDDDAEWKMTRFLKPLANKRLIISEQNGRTSSPEQDYYSGGIVFVDRSSITEACGYYLRHPKERARVAEEGFKLFRAKPEGQILKDLVWVQERTGIIKL